MWHPKLVDANKNNVNIILEFPGTYIGENFKLFFIVISIKCIILPPELEAKNR